MKHDPVSSQFENLPQGGDALEQSVGLNRILLNLVETLRRTQKAMTWVVVLSLLCNVVICGLFLWYESQFTYETVTTTTTVEQDTDGPGNNVYQSGENAEYVQEGVTDDGETEGNYYNND